MKKLIVYDLDGTLVDTRQDIIDGVNAMLIKMGKEKLPDKEIESYVGSGLRSLMSRALKEEDDKKVQKAGKFFMKYYGKNMLENSILYPGALETLKYFKDRKQAVLTNKPSPFAEDMLQGLKVSHYFVKVIAGGPGKRHKPDPFTFTEMMHETGVSREETLFIGDSAVDWETGKNAGVKTILMSHGFSSANELELLSPDALVHSFGELLAEVKKNNW